MTPRNFWRVLAPVVLLCALLVLLLWPSADAARVLDETRPSVNESAVASFASAPEATSTVAEPTATRDWSGLAVAMSDDGVEAVPPAPPLSLPDVAPTTAATQIAATPTAVAPTVTPTAVTPTAVTPTAVTPTAVPTSSVSATAVPTTAVPTTTVPTALSATAVPTVAAEPTTVPAPPKVAAPTAVPTATAVPTRVKPVVPSPTPAPAPVAAAAPVSTLDSRGRQALAKLGIDINSLGYTISFHAHTGGHRGLTFTTRNHIEIYIKPTTSDFELAYIIGHEVGHAVDHIRNTSADRARWMQARGMSPGTAWWPTGIKTDFATPAGDFAECFASWRLGSPSHSVWGGCGAMLSLMAELATS